jgi:hypothetical protein
MYVLRLVVSKCSTHNFLDRTVDAVHRLARRCTLAQAASQENCPVSEKVFSNLHLHSRSTDLQRVDYLDALRGIAILGVILVHSVILSHQGGLLGMVGLTGQRGVQLFYMVSAFTLFMSLDSRHTEQFQWSNFFIRRLTCF